MIKKCPVCNSSKFLPNLIEHFYKCQKCGFESNQNKNGDFTVYGTRSKTR